MRYLLVAALVSNTVGVTTAQAEAPSQQPAAQTEKRVQAQIILTVAESKRLIAKGVAEMPIVKEALKNGRVIIAKGTTNTYVAEEILGRKIPHGAYVYGRTFPSTRDQKFKDVEPIPEFVIVKGEVQEGVDLKEAVTQLEPGDVVIKGGNALDYPNKTAGVMIGSKTGGTSGTIMPYVVARKAHLVIPIGLEKQVAGNVVDISLKLREPMGSLNWIPSMFLLTGHIFTELEALKTLTGVTAHQVGAGGIGGAQGSVRLICRGTKQQVQAALKLAEEIQGEPPFVP